MLAVLATYHRRNISGFHAFNIRNYDIRVYAFSCVCIRHKPLNNIFSTDILIHCQHLTNPH